MNNAQNVSAAKPPIGGAIYAAPVGTTLPTDTDTALDPAFKDLGFVSSDGITNGTNIDSSDVKAWGGDTVLTTINSKDDTFKFNLIETLREDVLKFVYGAANVSGSLLTGLHIGVSSQDVPEVALVIDMLLRGNVKKRFCVAAAKISNVEDIVYNDNNAIGYNTTLKCSPGSDGYTHHEYIKAANISG